MDGSCWELCAAGKAGQHSVCYANAAPQAYNNQASVVGWLIRPSNMNQLQSYTHTNQPSCPCPHCTPPPLSMVDMSRQQTPGAGMCGNLDQAAIPKAVKYDLEVSNKQ